MPFSLRKIPVNHLQKRVAETSDSFDVLNSFAYILFHVPCKDDGEKDDIQQHIQGPGYREAQHNVVKGLIQRINEPHPDHAQTKCEENVGYAGEHRIAKCLKGVGNDYVDGVDEGKQRNVKHSAHTVVDGFRCIGSHHQPQKEPTAQTHKQSDGAGNGDVESQKGPEALNDAFLILRAQVLSDKGSGCDSESTGKGACDIVKRGCCGVSGNRLNTVRVDTACDLQICQGKDQVGNARRNTEAQNLQEGRKVKVHLHQIHSDVAFYMRKIAQDQNRADQLRYNGGDGNCKHLVLKDHTKDQVQCHVDYACGGYIKQRSLGVTHGSQNRGGVVVANEGRCGSQVNTQIGHGTVKAIRRAVHSSQHDRG